MLTIQHMTVFISVIGFLNSCACTKEVRQGSTFSIENYNRNGNNVTVKMCCSDNRRVFKDRHGKLGCVPPEIYLFKEWHMQDGNFPNCSFKILNNKNYRWFQISSETVEVGIIYLLYPVWLKTSQDYCVGRYKEDRQVSDGTNERNMLIVFCGLKGFNDYNVKAGLTTFIVLGSAVFNGATMLVYILVKQLHKSREWLQFAIFSAECLGHLIYGTHAILQSFYLIWTDSLKFPQILMYLGYYMYTVKYALVIATSVDLLLCVWKPFTSADESRRSKRNMIAILICLIVPVFIPALTNLTKGRPRESYMNSNIRLLDGIPSLYEKLTKIAFFAILAINISLGVASAVLIHRQMQKSNVLTGDEERALKNNRKSFVLYVKLICVTEIPFFLSFVLLVWFTAGNPLSLWWNLTRGAYLISSIYVFIFFGCSKKHREHLSRMYRSVPTSSISRGHTWATRSHIELKKLIGRK